MNRSQLTQRFIALNSLKDVLKQKSLETFKNGQEGDSNHVKGKYTCRRSGVFSVFVKFPFFRLLPTVPMNSRAVTKKKKIALYEKCFYLKNMMSPPFVSVILYFIIQH